jgi:hypothetical protein
MSPFVKRAATSVFAIQPTLSACLLPFRFTTKSLSVPCAASFETRHSLSSNSARPCDLHSKTLLVDTPVRPLSCSSSAGTGSFFIMGVNNSLDKRYTYMITSVMLARQIPLLDTLPTTLTPLPGYSCALFNSLAALFRTPVLCFQSFAHSLTKTPGWGYLVRLSSSFASPSPIDFLVFCFHGLTNPFFRKPFVCTSIQNPRGVTLKPAPVPIRNRAATQSVGAKPERPGAYLRGVDHYERAN